MESFGSLDLYDMLDSIKGKINFNLVDSGMERPVNEEYSYALNKSGKMITIWIKGKNGKKIKINRIIELNPKFLSGVGLYSGDGNKTRIIGCSMIKNQMKKKIEDFFTTLFQDQFETIIVVQEDTKFFWDKIDDLMKINEKLGKPNPKKKPETKEINNEFMNLHFYDAMRKWLKKYVIYEAKKDEYDLTNKKLSISISNTKGSRTGGKSSRADSIILKGSNDFLPFLLYIIFICQVCIINGKIEDSGIKFFENPRTYSKFRINLQQFLQKGENSIYFNKKNELKRYIVRGNGDFLIIKKERGKSFEIRRTLCITPLFALFAGYYLAEGNSHDIIFDFWKGYVEKGFSSYSVGLTSSEKKFLLVTLDVLKSIFRNPKDYFNSWKIKFGCQYFPETIALGERLGIPFIRGGKKGQGKFRSIEISKYVGKWGSEEFPFLNEYYTLFSHIEATGTGVGRPHLMFQSNINLLIFSLIYELCFNINDLINFKI